MCLNLTVRKVLRSCLLVVGLMQPNWRDCQVLSAPGSPSALFWKADTQQPEALQQVCSAVVLS